MKDYSNHILFITGLGLDGNDGSVIPTALGVNPALTIAAIAEKVSSSIAANL